MAIDTGPEDYEDAPIAIQLVGMKQNDQKFTMVTSIIDSILTTK